MLLFYRCLKLMFATVASSHAFFCMSVLEEWRICKVLCEKNAIYHLPPLERPRTTTRVRICQALGSDVLNVQVLLLTGCYGSSSEQNGPARMAGQ